MIKVSGTSRTVRETTCPYIYTDEKGKEQTETIRVRYYSLTWGELQAQHAKLKAIADETPDAPLWPHEVLAERLESLPDLTDEKGKPFAITADNLGGLDTRNIKAMKAAIDEDFQGK